MLDNKSLADVPSKTKTYFQHAGRHFVSLSFNQYLASDDTETPRPAVVSGFIVESHDIWFYATAGHVINGIRDALNAGVMFDAWRLGDDTAGSRFPAVPIDFEIGQCVVMHDNCIGLDYAVFPLHVLTARNALCQLTEPLGKQYPSMISTISLSLVCQARLLPLKIRESSRQKRR